MAPICKLLTLSSSLRQPASYSRCYSSVKTKQENYPHLDPELLREIHNVPFVIRSSSTEPYVLPLSASPPSSSLSTLSTTLSFELSSLLAHVFRKGVSVTTILSETMPMSSRMALANWRRNQIALVFGGDEEAFGAEMQRVKRTGSHLHACIARHLCGGQPIAADELAPNRERHSIEGFWNSLYPIFEEITGARLHEVPLAHPLLFYTGVFDSLIEYKGQLCLVDWKTKRHRRVKSIDDTYEDPLQLAAYAGAWNVLPSFETLPPPTLPLTEMEHLLQRLRSKLVGNIIQEAAQCKSVRGLLVYAYEDGECATAVHIPPAELYIRWEQWLQRYEQFVTERLRGPQRRGKIAGSARSL